MPSFTNTEFIVIKKRNLSEADRLITIFSSKLGKLTVIAKGVRRPTSRKKGSLELFSHSKGQITQGKSLGMITETETINTFSQIRRNLKKASVAYFFSEAVDKIIQENENNKQAFDLLLVSIHQLEKQNNLRSIRDNFTRNLLVISGFFPSTHSIKDPDKELEKVFERDINSIRIGKRMLT